MKCIHHGKKTPKGTYYCKVTDIPCPYAGLYVKGQQSIEDLEDMCLFASDAKRMIAEMKK